MCKPSAVAASHSEFMKETARRMRIKLDAATKAEGVKTVGQWCEDGSGGSWTETAVHFSP